LSPEASDPESSRAVVTAGAGPTTDEWAWVRPFIVRVGINALTLLAALVLFSFIRLPGTNAAGQYVLNEPLLEITGGGFLALVPLGLSLALVETFVRPILTALFGKFVIRSYGLLILLINALVFWTAILLVTGLTKLEVAVPDPRWLWMLVVAALFSAAMLAMNTLLGLNRPRIRDIGSRSPFWHIIDRLPLSGRSKVVENLRLGEVRRLIYEYALDISLSGTSVGRLRSVGDRLLGRDPDEFENLSTPAKVRVMLQQLGPTYVKIGQMVSSRADLLPEEWRDELEKLQNDVPPVPYAKVEATITKELGRPPDEVYSEFDRSPLAAASLAQVHRARLPNGDAVAVKVQRPDIGALVRADLGVIEDLAEQGERGLSIARTLNLHAMVQEFGAGVIEELDYGIEAYHALRLAEVLEGMDGVHVPRVYLDYSSKSVITMEFVPGIKLTRSDQIDAAGIDREAVARRLLRAFIKQVLIVGFFHGDPHPGNLIIDPETSTVTFLDLGLMGQLDSAKRIQLLSLMWALRERDPAALATAILGVCERTGPVDEERFRSGIQRVCYQYWIYGTPNFSKMMAAIFGVLSENNLRLDKSLTLAMKSLIQAEQLITTLSPNFPLIEVMFEEGRELLEGEFTPERLAGMAKAEVTATMVELGQRLPSLREATFSWLDQYQRGRFVVTIDTGDLQKGIQSISSVSKNLTIGLIVAGQLVALALVLAIVINSQALDQGMLNLLTLVFVGFLGYSVVYIRRVSRSDGKD
jgi:ubiquinone biosynthesis protein